MRQLNLIEKCSSPIGDGNNRARKHSVHTTIEKCSSPIGDGNAIRGTVRGCDFKIEKCSSPIGDGNDGSIIIDTRIQIEKCSSPIGDGNLLQLFRKHSHSHYN